MHRTRRPAVESLEARRLMSATAAVTATLADGVLTVTGTDRRDAVVFSVDPTTDPDQLHVVAGRDGYSFDLGEVGSVVVNTGAGNDRVIVDERTGAVFLSFVVDAGAGNDTVVTGSGNDVVLGGGGKDTVAGGAGDDQVDGGAGNDRLAGGADNDMLLGEAGKDRLAGGAGDDNLDGGAGRDAVTAGAGADAVARDAGGKSEVRDRRTADRDGDGSYTVVDPANLSAELRDLHEQAVPGSIVARVEVDGNLVAIFYRFGADPQVYKTRLDVTDGAVELVDRQISPSEIRPSARAAFESRHPGARVLSVFQHAGAHDDVRYRDADGTIGETTTDDLVWTVDDAAEDADNDGVGDRHGQPGNGGHDGPGGPTGPTGPGTPGGEGGLPPA